MSSTANLNLQIQPITLTERFDEKKLLYIINNKPEFRKKLDKARKRKPNKYYDPIEQAKKYYARNTDGRVKVDYKYAKNSVSGRMFANVGMQGMQRELRHTIAEEFYVDLDMVNAHPVILDHLLTKEEIKHPILKRYVENRDAVLKELDSTKIEILSIINGKFMYDSDNQLKNDFVKELEVARDKLCEIHADGYGEQVELNKSRGKDFNHPGTFVNIMMTSYENKILMILSKQLIKGNGVLCFDGLMIPKQFTPTPEDIINLELSIKRELKINIKLKIKPMDQGFKITRKQLKTVKNLSPAYSFEYFRERIKTVDTEDKLTKFKESLIDWMNSQYSVILESKPYNLKIQYSKLCRYSKKRSIEYVEKFPKSMKDTDFADKILTASNFSPEEKKGERKLTAAQLKKIQTVDAYGIWFTSGRRNVFNGITFDPELYYKMKEDPYIESDKFNKFNGLAIDKDDCITHDALDETHEFFNHIKRRWCRGDEASYKFVLDWLAHLIQFPWKKMKCAIVLKSGERAGKGIIIQIIAEILGANYFFQPASAEEVLGNFNCGLEGKCLIFLDEMVWGGNKEKAGVFKKLVSEVKTTIKTKFMSNRIIEMVANILLASNEDWIAPIGVSSTRWAVFRLLDELALMEEKKKLKIINEIQSVDRFKLAKFFYNRDLSNFNPTKIPMTAELRTQKINSLSKFGKWWYEAIYSNNLNFGKFYGSNDLFKNYIEDSGDKHTKNNQFINYLEKYTGYLPKSQQRTGAGRRRGFILPDLEECRKKWKYANSDPAWPFPDNDDDDDEESDEEEEMQQDEKITSPRTKIISKPTFQTITPKMEDELFSDEE